MDAIDKAMTTRWKAESLATYEMLVILSINFFKTYLMKRRV
ncbi:hypothetical protein [Cytobacillus horneckiae]